MRHGENIVDMQKRYTHLINCLNALGKPISNEMATNKVLRCRYRECQPKFTSIKEANNLLTLDITTLFDKIEEHEQELIYLEKHEKKIKKNNNKVTGVEKKLIALVASSSKSTIKKHDESESSDMEKLGDEEIRRFVKGYHKYIEINGEKHSENNFINFRIHVNFSKPDENKKGKSKDSCFNCGKAKNYKLDYP